MFALEQYPLNFNRDDLAPYMSAATIDYHYGKHLDTYIKNLNGLIAGMVYENLSLDQIIIKSAADAGAQKIFNNAAQAFNHNFFFRGLARDKQAMFPEKIATAFGTKEKFFDEFKASALAVFGSGWTWLVNDMGNLKIINTPNADTPMAHGFAPLLTLDVWEHAYYLDYQNRRADFIDAFLGHLVDWDFVSNNL